MFSFQDFLKQLAKKHLTKSKTAAAVFLFLRNLFILLKIRTLYHSLPRINRQQAVRLLFV
jgi:predicted membrane channel-forming protein YqfA (hemolysin III family)